MDWSTEGLRKTTLKRVTVAALMEDGSETDAVIEYWEGINSRCAMQLTIGGKDYQSTAHDFFECLTLIRRNLDLIGARLQCYGSSRNVFPSGMARDMGGGLRAYKLTMGRQTSTEDLVGIFESGDDFQSSTVEDQQQFARDWQKSLQ